MGEHQHASAQNEAYDAFVAPLDFSSGKYGTRVVAVASESPKLKRGDEMMAAKLFAKDIVEKYGAGRYCVSVLEAKPYPVEGTTSLAVYFVEG